MAHVEQRQFVERVKEKFPENFRSALVLELGALNINGTVRDLFDSCAYTGVDVVPGTCVDVVSKAHELSFRPGAFDTVISCEALEHDVFWVQTLKKAIELLIPGGLLVMTCAAPGRLEHGTPQTSPHESGTSQVTDMAGYYGNLTEGDIRAQMDVGTVFSQHEFETNGTDLYFWGVKCRS